jgi:hypothetical protein
MRDYWSEDGDILVHEKRGRRIGWLFVLIAIVGVGFLAASTWLVGLLGNLILWFFFALQLLSFVRREEFDRRTNIMRRYGVLASTGRNHWIVSRMFRCFMATPRAACARRA